MSCLSKHCRSRSDQLVSEEANWSVSALFVIKYVNFYQKPRLSNLIGWKFIYLMTNSASPDQLASSSEASWSGYTLFAKTGHAVFSKRRVNLYHFLGSFSRWQIDDIFLYFSQKTDLIVHANCLHRRQFAWKCQILFSGRKIFQNVICWKFYQEC